jgi:hypothetical protein
MRKPNQIAIDRALLLYLLQLVEPNGLLGDVKLQQLAFLCELQMFGKGLKGLHFEFFRYAYGAFSKDLDNDLTSLRRKERIENFTVTDKAEQAIRILLEGADNAGQDVEANGQVLDVLRQVIDTYGGQDTDKITSSVEAVEISTPAEPEFKIAIRDVSFHTILLVPARIETKTEFMLPAGIVARLNTALGY